MQAGVVEHSGELDDCCQCAHVAGIAEILVSDDGLTDRLSLRDLSIVRLEELEGKKAAGELKGKARGGLILGRGADVVEKSGDEESLRVVTELREVLSCDCLA